MNPTSSKMAWGLWVVLLGVATNAHATSLTFNIYTNAGKTDPFPNSVHVPLTYGDNVTDFEPTNAFGANYYSYGTNGGLTPLVAVNYGWFLVTNPLSSFGNGFAAKWDFGYIGLTNTVFPAAGVSWYTYISLSNGLGPVRLDSFDYARFGAANVAGQTLKVVKNQLSSNPVTLWAAGPDLGVTAGLMTNYTPNAVVEAGETLFLVFGTSGNTGLDNITFTQLPEPSTVGMCAIAVILFGALRKRR